jgi:hypothetical protein
MQSGPQEEIKRTKSGQFNWKWRCGEAGNVALAISFHVKIHIFLLNRMKDTWDYNPDEFE